MAYIEEVAENIYLIDDNLYSIPRWGAVYLINEERKALIDSGPTTSASAVIDGIKRAGISPEDIDYIIPTHVHLDHGGGAGFLLRYMPKAQVIVHHKGARHLMNPTRLIHAVIEVQYKEYEAKNGEVVPIETERVRAVYEGDVIELSEEQALRFIEAPGHASHQLAIHESRNNGIFTGDSVGAHIVGDEAVLVPITPPGFDLELCLNTLERLMKLDVSAIYYAHFGVSSTVQEDLQTSIDKLKSWSDIVSKAVKEGEIDRVEEIFTARVYPDLEPIRRMGSIYEHIINDIIPLNVAGFIKNYQEKRKTELSGGRQGESHQR